MRQRNNNTISSTVLTQKHICPQGAVKVQSFRKFEMADTADLGFGSYRNEEGYDYEDWDEEGWDEGEWNEGEWDEDAAEGGVDTAMPGVKAGEVNMAVKVNAANEAIAKQATAAHGKSGRVHTQRDATEFTTQIKTTVKKKIDMDSMYDPEVSSHSSKKCYVFSCSHFDSFCSPTLTST